MDGWSRDTLHTAVTSFPGSDRKFAGLKLNAPHFTIQNYMKYFYRSLRKRSSSECWILNKNMKKSSSKPSLKGKPMGVVDHIVDLYKNPMKWYGSIFYSCWKIVLNCVHFSSIFRRFIKHTTIFILAVYGARTFSDIDLMAPPQPLQ